MHAQAWCGGERKAGLGLGRVSAQVRHSGAASRCRRAARWSCLTGRGLGRSRRGGEQWTEVKGADGWEIQQAGEERLGVMPTSGGAGHSPFTRREPRRRCEVEEREVMS